MGTVDTWLLLFVKTPRSHLPLFSLRNDAVRDTTLCEGDNALLWRVESTKRLDLLPELHAYTLDNGLKQ